ncbi:coenzyme A pyrophosphatase [Desulfuromonas versatilis]|uniref:Coenzyme A pyrophosphatase n=1 Tax=Desulfuromonas versatilis TaxID=2802975 RepID=A0ABM8HRX9_9BACT|nr:CoA pyrophosphatase [Desulfuromonas versatilis]BCR05036.1 coenzyme A pyrophosphatase [Desulfuromonas versatilis]
MFQLADIRDTLAERQPRLQSELDRRHAAVALVLRGPADALQLLFIQRSSHPRDPWSGNLAFPGGKIDPQDHAPRLAAEREAREEVGLELAGAEFLGRLDDITGAYLPVLVSCFVYHLARPAPLRCNHEVNQAFWFPLDKLLDPARHALADIPWGGQSRKVLAIDLLGPGRPVLWGITYRLVQQFVQTLGLDFPRSPCR